MNKFTGKTIFFVTILCIILPLAVVAIWSVSQNWRFPNLLPDGFSSRGLDVIMTPMVISTLFSSISISVVVAIVSTIIGTLTARALVFYDFAFKNVVKFINLLPLMIPASAFAMGIHIFFIKMGLSDTIVGVILIHLICGLPYSVNIMTDMTSSVGKKIEEQAMLLGATPTKAFFHTNFYALIPAFVTSFSMTYIISFSQYFITLIIGGGNVKTLSTIMMPYIQGGDRTISGAYSMIFIVATLLVFFVVQWVSKKVGSDRAITLYR